MGNEKYESPGSMSEPRNVEDMFYKLVELYATIKADTKHIASREWSLELLNKHSKECPSLKRHRILVMVGSMIAGAGFIGGLFLRSFFVFK